MKGRQLLSELLICPWKESINMLVNSGAREKKAAFVRTIDMSSILVWFDFCVIALQHILGNFGHGQLPLPHCSWASLLGSLPVLSAHSFAGKICPWKEGISGLVKICLPMARRQLLTELLICHWKESIIRLAEWCAHEKKVFLVRTVDMPWITRHPWA